MKTKTGKIVKAMVMAAVVALAFAAHADTEKVGDWTWTYRIVDGEAEIYNDGDIAISPDPVGEDISVPSTLGGKTVTKIGENAFVTRSFTSVTIPASVKSIGAGAFWNCSLLESVKMPGVKEIGEIAFWSCARLSTVEMPSDVKITGYGAFTACPSLADENDLVIIDNVLYGGGASGKLPENFIIPATVTRIADYAFSGFWGDVQGVTIPGSVKSIGEYAFDRCTLNNGVAILDGVESIGDGAFYGSELKSVTIPGSVKSIGESAFYNCDKLANATLLEGVETICSGAFRYCGISSLSIPSSVTTIGSSAISSCDTIYVAAGDVNRVKDLIPLPDGELAAIEFVEPSGAFAVTFDANGGDCGASPRPVKKNTAVGALPWASRSGCTFDGWWTEETGGTEVTADTVVSGNVTYYAHWMKAIVHAPEYLTETVDGIAWTYRVAGVEAEIYNDDNAAIPDTTAGAITIPSTLGGYQVTSIGAYAFQQCTALTSVTIPNSVTSIGTYAFYQCSTLNSVTIPNSVTSIGSSAFSGCPLATVYVDKGDGERVKGLLAGSGFSTTGVAFVEDAPPPDGDYAETVDGIEWHFRIAGGKAEIYNNGDRAIPDTTAGAITVPSTLGGCPVTRIGDYAFMFCYDLTSVTIPSGVTSIGECAFEACTGMTSVTIPASVTSIGEYAFDSCYQLTSVSIPEGVTSIGMFVFYCCYDLASVTIPASVTEIGGGAFVKCSGLTSFTVAPENGYFAVQDGMLFSKDGKTLVSGLVKSGYVTIPDGVTAIGDYAFSYQLGVESVTIPQSVKSIGIGAFSYCEYLASAQLPCGVETIGEWAFDACTALASVTIPDSVTSIGENAFHACDNLATVNVAYGDTARVKGLLEASGFDTTGVAFVEGEPPTGPANDMFANATTISGASGSVSGSNVDATFEAGEPLYGRYNSTKTVWWTWTAPADGTVTFDTIGSSFDTVMGAYTGDAVGSLTFIAENDDAESGVTTSKMTFDAFEGITYRIAVGGYESAEGDITLNWSLVEAPTPPLPDGDYAETVDGIEWHFRIADGKAEIYNDGYAAIPDTTAGAITVPSTLGLRPVTGIGDYAFYYCNQLTDVTIPDGVTSIGDYAFYRCSSLASVTIPDSVTEIGEDAFIHCTALENVAIPDNVTRIGNYAFYGCSSLTSATIPASVTKIGASPFGACAKLTSLSVAPENENYYVQDGMLIKKDGNVLICCVASTGNVTIPVGVTRIGYYGFGYNTLAGATIPSSVTKIDDGAFYGCGNLASVTIPSSVTEIGEDAFYNCVSLATVYVDEGDTARVKALLEGSGFNTTGLTFVEDVPTTCTVTLELNGGSGIETTLEVEPGAAIGLLPIPDGYDDGIYKYHNFYGWFWDAGFTDEVEPTDVVSGDCTCYAKWGLSPDLQTTVVDGIAWSYFEVGKTVTLYNNGRSVIPSDYEGSLTIPAKIAGKTVAGIGMCAFYGCTGLTSVIIPDGVEDISDKAFAWCENLQVVQFGKGVSKGTIFDQAFKGCSRLRALDFKATKSVYAVEDAFEDAGTLTGEGKPCVYVPKSAAKTWGDKWMGMRVLAYPFQVQFIMGIMPGKASYGTVTPIPYGPATEIGKKVTLKAKANKTYVFAGWYDCDWNDSENPDKQVLVSRAPSYSYTVTGEFKHFKADFVKEEEDIASLAINVADVRTAGDGSVTIDIGAAVDSYSEPKVTVKGLPSGLKYDAKTMSITGKATKPGVYTVTISATNASQTKAKTAEFLLTVPNFKDDLVLVADSYPSYGTYIPGVEYTENIPAAADCAVTGLPTGMKWTAKDVVDPKTKLVTVPANSAYGAPTKPGRYTVYFTKTVGKEKHVATATFVVGPLPVVKVEAFGNGTGKATGAGGYLANKKVTLKATADTKDAAATLTKPETKKSVFGGWYEDDGATLLSLDASYAFDMPSADITLKAKFITAAEEAAYGIASATLSGVAYFDKDNLKADKVTYCGVYEEWRLDVDSLSFATVKVAGLPAGMKFTAKDVVDSKTKAVLVPANTIYGAPTAASKIDARTGLVKPSEVKITVTTAGKSTASYTVKVTVEDMKASVYGQFEGGGLAGQATLTVAATGKISGKYLSDGLTWTLSAPYFDDYDGVSAATATIEAKCNKDVKALSLFVSDYNGTVLPANAILSDEHGNEVARLRWTAWKTTSPWTIDRKVFPANPVLAYDSVDLAGTTGTVTLKFAQNGKVTLTGEFGSYKASGSAVIVPTDLPEVIGGVVSYPATVYVYLPPKAGKFAGLVDSVNIRWTGTAFVFD